MTSATRAATATDACAPAEGALGDRLRRLRQGHSLSLQGLAARAGLSVGTISQMERSLTQPSLRTLNKLATALGVPTAFFFEDGHERGEVDGIVVRAGTGAALNVDAYGVAKELLTPRQLDCVQLMLVRLRAEASSGSGAYDHPGSDAGYVLSGSLNLEVDGKIYVLAEGDSFGFDSGRPHRFENRGQKEAVVIWVNTQRTLGG